MTLTPLPGQIPATSNRCSKATEHRASLQDRLLYLLLAMTLVLGLLPPGLSLLANPGNALAAETAKFTTVEVSASGKSYQMYAKADGSLAYCYDPGSNPPTTAATYTLTNKKDPIAAWIVANGYPYTQTIDGKSWTKGQAQCVTQIALWFYRSYGSDPDDYYPGCDSYMKTLFHDPALVDAALALCKKALRYDGSDDAINNCITIWNSSDPAMQDTLLVGAMTGTVKLLKESADTKITAGNSCYSLAGATFGVFTDEKCRNQVDTLTTDAKGKTPESKELAVGTYYVKELYAPRGFSCDETPNKVTVKAGETASLTLKDEPLFNPLDILLNKVDRETNQPVPLGSATLAHAWFTVSHYGGYFDSPEQAKKSGDPLRTWVFSTDDEGKIDLTDPERLVEGDELYASDGKKGFPLGTYVFEETRAPYGYLPLDEPFCVKLTEPAGIPVEERSADAKAMASDSVSYEVGNYAAPQVPEQVFRGDLAFVKADEISQRRLANCAFLLTSITTGETHVIVTDPNGSFSTRVFPHKDDTNANDAAVTGYEIAKDDQDRFALMDISNVQVDDEALDYRRGTWFGTDLKGNTASPDNSLGALPYDMYLLTELPCKANSQQALGHSVILYQGTEPLRMYRDGLLMDLGTIDNQPAEIPGQPSIGTLLAETKAKQKDPASKPSESTELTDVVSYENLTEGTSYQFASILFDATTDLPVLKGDFASHLTSQELQDQVAALYDALGIRATVPAIAYEQKKGGIVTLKVEGESQVLQSSGTVDYARLQELTAKGPLAPYLVTGLTDCAMQQDKGDIAIDLPAFDSRPYGEHTTVCFEVLFNQETQTVDAVEVNEANTDQQVTFSQKAPSTQEPGKETPGTHEEGGLYKTGSGLLWLGALAGLAIAGGCALAVWATRRRRTHQGPEDGK